MFLQFSCSNKPFQFLSKRTFILNENWNYRNFLVSEEHDNLKLNNMQEIYQYIINRTNIKKDFYVNLLNMTLESYLPYKTPVQIQKIINGMAIPSELHIKYNKTITINEEKFSLPLLTVNSVGRLGNIMGEYASLFALGKLYNVSVLLLPEMKEELQWNIPTYHHENFDRKRCVDISFDDSYKDICNYSPIQLAAAGLFGPLCFIIRNFCDIILNIHTTQCVTKVWQLNLSQHSSHEKIWRRIDNKITLLQFLKRLKTTKEKKFNNFNFHEMNTYSETIANYVLTSCFEN
ncbi:hypothetical protein Anas_14091 [Armadillidium nasatum]|uniref:L-Fucosyltransferase n=1 Tax=Armadillidium nasatum TaxID=96803 RepID=A0A5N5T682_9CRUS|nr:hypothetical protein Anas_14091 [Armadillidium nasatum]